MNSSTRALLPKRCCALLLLSMFAAACGDSSPPESHSEAGAVLRDGFVQVAGRRLRIGVPKAEWIDALGPGVEHFEGAVVYWPEHRVMAFMQMTACRDDWVAGVRLTFEDGRSIEGHEAFGAPIQLEGCVLEKGDVIEQNLHDCGACILEADRPFWSIFKCDANGAAHVFTRDGDAVVHTVEYTIARENRLAIGAERSPEEQAEFREAGLCEGRRERVILGQTWRDQQEAEREALKAELWGSLREWVGGWFE